MDEWRSLPRFTPAYCQPVTRTYPELFSEEFRFTTKSGSGPVTSNEQLCGQMLCSFGRIRAISSREQDLQGGRKRHVSALKDDCIWIVVIGDFTQNSAQRPLQLGFDGLLAYPFSLGDLR
jgi:hypothetical protein